MQQKIPTETALIRALSGADDAARKAALRCLFEHASLRKQAIAHVHRYGGNRQDGEDVFQEALIVMDRKIRQGVLIEEGKLEAYFMGIVRWHWFNEQQRKGRMVLGGGEHPPALPAGGDPEQEFLLLERREQLEGVLKKLQEKCRSILKMYQLDYSMDEIAQKMGYANSGVAKKETHLCRQRFRILLEKGVKFW